MNFLAFLDEMWFLATRPMVTVPKFFADFQVRELPVYFPGALPSPISQIHGRFPLPLLWFALSRWLSLPPSDLSIPHGLQLGFVKVFLADHVHACSGATIFSFLQLYCGCGRQNPLIGRRIECSFFPFV